MANAKAVTEKEVEASRNKVARLNADVAAAEAELVAAEAARNNAAEKASFDTEADRLEAHLASIKERIVVSKTEGIEDTEAVTVAAEADTKENK